MGDMKPITRPSETRQTIKELVAMGCTVDWNTVTGSVRIVPPAAQSGGKPDAFDMVDFKR